MLLVAAGVTLAVAVVSQERALREGSARAADRFDLLVAPPGSRTDALLMGVFLRPGPSRLLGPELTAALLADERATFVSPLAFGDSFRGMPVVGVTAALVGHLSGPLAEGRLFSERLEAVVGAASPLHVGERFSPAHGVHHGGAQHGADDGLDAHRVSIAVVGRMQPTGSPWDRAVIVPVETVWSLHGLPDGHAAGSARIGPPYDAARVPGIPAAVLHPRNLADAYRLRSAYSGTESMAFFPAEALVQLYAVLGDMRRIMSLFAIVTQALVLLSVVASTFILFRLLTPQFVTLRALGAPRRYVFLVAWGFSALLFCAGVALGLLGGYGLSFAISVWLARMTGVSLQPGIGSTELLMASILLVVGLALAMLPAWRMQRIDLASAMRAW